MKTLDFNEMENVNGGCSSSANKAIAICGLITGGASMIGPVGLLIAGPAALGMGIAGVVCAFQ